MYRFRLLIQRCERWREIGNLFDKGKISPDEGDECPTNGLPGGDKEQRTPRVSCPKERQSGTILEDVQACGDFVLVAFADGDLVSEEIDGIATDVVDLIDIDDIRTVNL